MVHDQLVDRGIRDPRVLEAMGRVPREQFIEPRLRAHAYDDSPLPIDQAQTISQPYIVALMIQAAHVKPGDRVLEVGAGSGYALAVLAEIGCHAFGVEWYTLLADRAQARLAALGYDHARVRQGDGAHGWPEHAPYDAILVSACGPSVPDALLDQLRIDGRLVAPVGQAQHQELVQITRNADDTLDRQTLAQVQFIPLVGSGAITH